MSSILSRLAHATKYTNAVLTSYRYPRIGGYTDPIDDTPSIRLFIDTHQSARSCHLAQPSPQPNTPNRRNTFLYTLSLIINPTIGPLCPPRMQVPMRRRSLNPRAGGAWATDAVAQAAHATFYRRGRRWQAATHCMRHRMGLELECEGPHDLPKSGLWDMFRSQRTCGMMPRRR